MKAGRVALLAAALTGAVLISTLAADRYHEQGDDLSPREALASFELQQGFKIELLASEPLVSDPIDMEIDEHGRIYVLEMHGYPTDQSGSDRIVLLQDTDGDGRMDGHTVFADSLVWPMGIMRWKDGLLVTEAPDVIYLEDVDGDGRADVRERVLTGFFDQDPESDVNNPTYGLDNWIYLANTRRSENDIRFVDRTDTPRIPSEATGRNVRFHPDRGWLEAQSGRTQFGFTFDRWGRALFVNNRNHIYQEVIPARYLDRRPELLVANASASISDHGAAARVFPITADPNPQLLTDIGEFTAACGITFYDGGAFPADYDNVAFVAEPAHNLVHADDLTSEGPTLTASRLEPHSEFLASTDSWFRPVNLYIGPDGALYVVDYYRQIIEGPEWLADDVLQSGDLYNGSDKGRIYRITPEDAEQVDWTTGLDFGRASDAELAEFLAHPNIWWRRHAQRMLMDRQSHATADELTAMARASDVAVGRVHALWTLAGLDLLDDGLIGTALRDPEPGVRENAIRLAEQRLGDAPDLQETLLTMRDDPDRRVRFQLLLTLGNLTHPDAATVREALLFEAVEDPWVQLAALSAPETDELALLSSVVSGFEPSYAPLVRRLSGMIAGNHPAEALSDLLRQAANPRSPAPWQGSVLEGIAEGLNARAGTARSWNLETSRLVDTHFDHPSDTVRQAALRILEVTGLPSDAGTAAERAVDLATDDRVSAERRAQAIDVLRLAEPAVHADMLRDLIVPNEPTAVQIAAVRAFGNVAGTAPTEFLLENWPILTPEVRDEVLSTILSWPLNTDRIVLLLDAIKDGRVHPAAISWPHKVTLMRDIPDALKTQARDLITSAEAQRRQDVVAFAAGVKRRDGNPERGRELFELQCALCHRLGDIAEGSAFGPDLMSVRGWTRENLVAHIVEPNLSITLGYDYWQIELRDGETLQGIVAEESANAVTIRRLNLPDVTIPRGDIATLRNLEASIMPADFMDRLSQQEMADLIVFIRTGR